MRKYEYFPNLVYDCSIVEVNSADSVLQAG